MKTSTTFACGIPETEKELNFLIFSLLEHDKKYKKDYGLQKIFNKTLNEYVGVMGLIRREGKLEGYSNNVVEGVIFLQSKYIGSGLGFWALRYLFANLEKLGDIMLASTWEGNTPLIKLVKNKGMELIGKTSKTYKGNTIGVEIFIKLPEGSFLKTVNIKALEELLVVNKLSNINI